MNQKVRVKDVQSAQGMVEFALVLPILLLVILGVFAFGHLFFVYSSVVSASREAARWGAAVGEAPSTLPRYQDCASIRAAALRVGAIAGVGTNSVEVNYDHGPQDPPPTPPYFDNCPLVGAGPDSTSIQRGDRIVVRVSVNYTPIVPLVNLPSFPLSAETARTIVKSVPVGDAPVAEDIPEPVETIIDVVPDRASSVTGEPVNFAITVRPDPDDGSIPAGVVTLSYDETVNGVLTPNVLGPLTLVNGQATFGPVTFQSAEVKDITFAYGPDSDDWELSNEEINFAVDQAATELYITDPNDPSQIGNPVNFTVQLSVLAPGAITTSGPLEGENLDISYHGGSCTPLNSALMSMCTFTPNQVNNNLTVTVTYPENANTSYAGYSKDELHIVNRQGITLAVNASPSSVAVGGSVTVTVSATLPSRPPAGGESIEGESISVTSGDDTCTLSFNASMVGTCTLTPENPDSNYTIVAHYPGSAIYDATTAVTSISVEDVDTSPWCPYFASDRLSFPASDTFSIGVTNPGSYRMRISSLRLRWAYNADAEKSTLWQVRFHPTDTGTSCSNQDEDQCVWYANNPNQGLNNPSGNWLSMVPPVASGTSWVGNLNPGISGGTTQDLLFKFSAGLLSTGRYSLEVTFDDGSGHTCTTDPIIDYTR